MADKAGTVGDRPLVRQRRPLPRVDYVTAVIVRPAASSPTAATLLTRRPATGLLAGMWEFPTTELHRHPAGAPVATSPTSATLTNAALQLLATLGLSGDPVAHPPPVKHTFSHFHATYHPVIVLCGADYADSPAMLPSTSAMPRNTPAMPESISAMPESISAMPQSISAMPQHPSAIPNDIHHPLPPGTIWIDIARLDDFALPVAQQKIGAQLIRLTHELLKRSPRGTPHPASG